MLKTSREIKFLKKAAKISDSCIPLIERSLKEGVTERELARRIRKRINSQGAALSFRTLVGSGKRSRMVHTKPRVTDREISGLGYVDFGASYRGYKADITVPFIRGKISARQRMAVDIVLRAYELGVRSVRIGEPCWIVHRKVDRFLRRHGFRMKHGLGHGLGLRVHERPSIVAPNKKLTGKRKRKWERVKKVVFHDGMVFTIEPGVYTKDFGCRIENDFLLKGGRLERLTNSRLIVV